MWVCDLIYSRVRMWHDSHSYVSMWFDLFTCTYVTWFTFICEYVTYSYMNTWVSHMAYSYVSMYDSVWFKSYGLFICEYVIWAIWLTKSYGLFICECVIWFIHVYVCDTIHLCALMCEYVIGLIHVWVSDMTLYVWVCDLAHPRVHMQHDSFMH